MKDENILYYTTLITTYNELIKVGHFKVAEKIQSILGANELPKPPKHNRIEDRETTKFLIEMTEEEIEIIQDLFLDLEVKNVSAEGHTTSIASFYADNADIWSNITPQVKTQNKNGV